MSFARKSLRTKFTLVLLVIGIIPIITGGLFYYFTSRDALFKSVFKELTWGVTDLAGQIESHFEETARNLLVASQNTAFRMYYLEPEKKGYWVGEQKKTLRRLRLIYSDKLDEACFIDSSGQELSRIVFDELAHDHDLSSEEDRQAFFSEAFRLEEGEVFQGAPAISEDTERWVLPNATPIEVNGKKVAILHFEINAGYFRRLVTDSVNPERGYGFILSDSGEYIAHSMIEMEDDAPFPRAITEKTPPGMKAVLEKMMAGRSGIELFSGGDKDYYISFRPVEPQAGGVVNRNRWSVAYVIPSDKVYVELSIIRYNLIAVALTLFFVVVLAEVLGKFVTRPIRELAAAARRLAAGEMPSLKVDRSDEIGQLAGDFNTMAEAIRRRDEQLKALATTDGLTGLYNRRHFNAELEREFAAARRFGRPLSLIIADIDWFKQYNDAHGHTEGDMVLKRVAGALMRSIREVDTCARYGGEEFVVILPETPFGEALRVAERVRATVEAESIPHEEEQPGGALTVSIGVAEVRDGIGSADELVKAADECLYRAKEKGRNRVWHEGGNR